MKQIIFSLFLSLVVVLSSCKGQDNDKKTNSLETGKPKTDIKVNKEYDENGNLITYDSTYSYYYSNIENDSILRDSIFNNFRNHFNKTYKFSDEPFFNNFFFNDSLIMYDFYKNDFFEKRFRNNRDHINRLFYEMDSIKNLFFEKQFKEFNTK